MENEGDEVERTVRWLEDVASGVLKREFEFLTLQGLRVVRARKDSFLCRFVVPDRLSDRDGNWHVGAMATLIDDVGAATVYCATGTGHVKATLDFSVSYLSTATLSLSLSLSLAVHTCDCCRL
ncbi:hypothetical protein BT93_F2443 [Corymbia citriodora subsp. variegata]|nr:hypothetical protein BT93_F2443 [Corymbia citriodora subsp. variegata]